MCDSENKENEDRLQGLVGSISPLGVKCKNLDEPLLDVMGKEIVDNTVAQGNKTDHTLMQYKTNIVYFKKHIDKLHYEIKDVIKDNAQKDQCISTCIKEKNGHRQLVKQLVKQLTDLEQSILRQSADLWELKQKANIDVNNFASAEKKCFQMVQKYKAAQTSIENFNEIEGNLVKTLENLENQIVTLNTNYESMKDDYSKEVKKTQEQVGQDNEYYKREIAKLQSMMKRLEIKTTSLETAFQQKSDECQALSALYDDLASRQSS